MLRGFVASGVDLVILIPSCFLNLMDAGLIENYDRNAVLQHN
jgi:hypothetical protein